MLAAAACAEDDTAPVPPELSIAWQVERWGAVAVFGNREIPVRILKRMSALSNVYSAMVSHSAGAHHLVDWALSHPMFAKIVSDIRQMRQNA